MPAVPTAIPADLEEPLLDRAGELHPATQRRWTTRQLAAWLAAEHQVAVDHTTVARMLRRLRRERTEDLREALRAELAAGLAPQFRRLDELATKLTARASALGRHQPTLKELALVVDTVRKVLVAKARVAGFAERIELDASVSVEARVSVDDARAVLAARLAGLAGAAGSGGADGAPGEPAG